MIKDITDTASRSGRTGMAGDVRECLMYAERGEVAGAFVYKTDAEQMAKDVKILFTVPQELYPRVTYPVGITAAGSKKAEAAAFCKSLRSAEAKAVLVKHGFIVKQLACQFSAIRTISQSCSPYG